MYNKFLLINIKMIDSVIEFICSNIGLVFFINVFCKKYIK